MFDPIIAEYEAKIVQLRQPRPRRFELKPSVANVAAKAKATSSISGVAVAAQQQPRPEFTVAPGFEVSLWAENPLLAKPNDEVYATSNTITYERRGSTDDRPSTAE